MNYDPTILTNSQIEGVLDQQSVSCITCHALAVKGISGDAMPTPLETETVNEEGFPNAFVGVPKQEYFLDEHGESVIYLGLDYVRVLRHAQREIRIMFNKASKLAYK